jgi:hypothetical protein
VAKTAKEQLGVDFPEQPTPDVPLHAQQPPDPPDPEDQAPGEEERPEWLPENYKTPEDFAASKKALENELRERGERMREMEERMGQLEQLAAQAERQPQYQAEDPMAQYAVELSAARENGDVEREVQLQQWLQQYSLQQAFEQQGRQQNAQQAPFIEQQHELLAVQAQDEMRRRHDDWEDNKDRIAQMLDSDPDLLTEQAANSYQGIVRSLDRAYRLVKAEDMAAELEELRKQGISAEDLGRARKLAAQTLPGSSGRPGEPSEADKQVAEMKQALHGSSYEHMPR